MEKKNTIAEKTVKHFNRGYNCAQSVLLAMSERWKNTSELVPKIATGFGGGIGRCGSVCGVLSGGVMALGIKYGTNEPSLEKRLKAYELAQKLYRRFEKNHGSVLCKELIGHDLSNPKELEEAAKAKVFDEKCAVFLKKTIETILELTGDN